MPTALYARYIPPKAAKSDKVPKKSSNLTNGIAPAPLPPPKRKREDDDSSVEKPKKLKRKKDKGSRQDHVTKATAEQELEQINPKHKAVLAKFEKSKRKSEAAKKVSADAKTQTESVEKPELHDLIPLPQPKPIREPQYIPTFSTLPPWLAEPTTVSTDTSIPFNELSIDPKIVERLQSKGYKNTFAVQSAVLPLLLRGKQQYHGDLCISAPTGSGKTLAYILPVIESIKGLTVTALQSVVVVPTRELVTQAKEMAEMCAAGTGIKIGVALGSQNFEFEQEALIRKSQKYDPEAAKVLEEKSIELQKSGPEALEDSEQDLDDFLECLPHHVPEYSSKVHILICTPGRLVEHIRSTRGFTLDDVHWLIIDEADRLLEQNFQEWVDVINGALDKKLLDKNPRDRVLSKLWPPQEKHRARKVICSATMTRDLSKLASLKLDRPKLIAVTGEKGGDEDRESKADLVTNENGVIVLPNTLKEFVVPAGDGSEKPLYLLKLLQLEILADVKFSSRRPSHLNGKTSDKFDDSSSSDDDSSDSGDLSELDDSLSSSLSSDSSSDSSSLSDSSSESSSPLPSKKNALNVASTKAVFKSKSQVLIFASSTSSATRLSFLISSLYPTLASLTETITKASLSRISRTIRRFNRGELRILIATDRVSRGLDLPNLSHVINYDVPRSADSYVHRVGRTARAGKSGEAWTLLEDKEARWFWNDIARAKGIERAQKVERKRFDVKDEELGRAYEKALGELKQEVLGKEE